MKEKDKYFQDFTNQRSSQIDIIEILISWEFKISFLLDIRGGHLIIRCLLDKYLKANIPILMCVWGAGHHPVAKGYPHGG